MHPFPPIAKKADAVLDPAFEASIAAFTDAVIQEEQKEFKPGLESFQVHANKLRLEMRDLMIVFQQTFQHGYEIITSWLDEHSLEKPEIAKDSLAILDNPEQFLAQVKAGRYIFQILGFSNESLINCYKAAYSLAQDKDYTKSRDAFFFLVTIAPDVADFWLGFSICTMQLKEFDQALDASLRTIALDPARSSPYQNALYIYSLTNETEKAHELCNQGIAYCNAHSQEPWAEKLKSTLYNVLEQLATKLQ